MKRLVGVLGVVLVIVFAAYLSAGLTEFPAAVVCDRGRPNVEVSSTAPLGYFEEHRIGGRCVTYTHKSRGRD